MLAAAVFLSLALAVAQGAPGKAPVALEIALAGNRYLEVKVVGRSAVPVLVTRRTHLGPYLEVEVTDLETGRTGWLGPRATATTPDVCEFYALRVNEVYGVRLDLLRPDILRFPDGSEIPFQKGRSYEVVVRFRDFEGRESLSREARRKLLQRVGQVIQLDQQVVGGPLRIKIEDR